MGGASAATTTAPVSIDSGVSVYESINVIFCAYTIVSILVLSSVPLPRAIVARNNINFPLRITVETMGPKAPPKKRKKKKWWESNERQTRQSTGREVRVESTK